MPPFGRDIQILPLDAISNGDQLQIDWRDGVNAAHASDVSIQVDLFAYDEATGLKHWSIR